MALLIVDYKSTIVLNGLSFLFSNVLIDHFVGDGAGADGQVAPCPYMAAPQLLPQVRELLKEYPRTDTLQPLGDSADVLMGAIAHQKVNVVARNFSRQNSEFMFHGDLS